MGIDQGTPIAQLHRFAGVAWQAVGDLWAVRNGRTSEMVLLRTTSVPSSTKIPPPSTSTATPPGLRRLVARDGGVLDRQHPTIVDEDAASSRGFGTHCDVARD